MNERNNFQVEFSGCMETCIACTSSGRNSAWLVVGAQYLMVKYMNDDRKKRR